MSKPAKLACVGKACVACGCCAAACPKGAVHIDSGIIARVNAELCIGCGKCAKICPAHVITMKERGTAV